MALRLELHDHLLTFVDNVYFQPPSNVLMQFPCILYSRDASHAEFADNGLYVHAKRYQLTVVDRNPDSPLPDQVETLPLCSFERYFAADDLSHWVFNLFF